ncbi:MAG TPA: hypothetical protein VJ729_14645 [Nitrososphaeraceae archaeon]|nr:hypothetical protein [Nitrososphaeraceae archaeon]
MKHGQQQQGKKIIFVFLVFTLVLSSLSAVAFVTGGNLAFASSKKKDDSSGDRGGGDGSGSDKGGNSGGSGDNGGGG